MNISELFNCPSCGGMLNEKVCSDCKTELAVVDNIYLLSNRKENPEIAFRDKIAGVNKSEGKGVIHEGLIRYCYVAGYLRHVKKFINKIPDGGYILDLGCGGMWYWHKYIELLRLRKITVVGVDFSSEYLTQARKKLGPTGIYICGDITKINIKESAFDGIWSCQALQHIKDFNEVGLLLKKASDSLKASGILEIRWLNYAPLIRLARWIARKQFKNEDVNDFFIRRLTTKQLFSLIVKYFDHKKISIYYEENIFNPDLGIIIRSPSWDYLERLLERFKPAKYFCRQLAVRAVR